MDKLKSKLKYILILNILIVPFLTCGYNEQSPFELIKLVVTSFLTIVTFAIFAVIEMRGETIKIKWNLALSLLGLLLLVVGASYYFSTNRFTSFWGNNNTPSDSMLTTLIYFLFSFLLVQLINSRADYEKISYALVTSGFFLASYGVVQHFGYDPVDWWGYRDMHINAYGTIGQAVGFGSILGALLPLSVMVYFDQKSKLGEWLILIAAFVISLGVLYSGSRSPAAVSFAAALFGASIYLYKNFRRSLIKKYVIWLFCAVAAIGIYFSESNTALTNKMQSEVLATGLGERQHIWKESLEIWKKYPFLGSGPETFALELKLVNGKSHNNYQNWARYWHKAHNHFFHYLATIGLLGLGAHLLIFGFVIFYILRIIFYKNKTPESYHGLGYLLGFSFIYVSNITAFNFIITQLYVFIFLTLFAIERSSFQGHDLSLRCPRFLNRANMLLICTILALFGFEIYKFWRADTFFSISRKNLVEENNLKKAIESIDSAIVVKSNDSRFYFRKATLLLAAVKNDLKARSNVDYSDVVRTLDDITNEGINLDRVNAESRYLRGKLFADLFESRVINSSEPAERSFMEAMVLNPVNPTYPYNLALIYYLRGSTEGFLKNMRLCIELKPDYLSAHHQLLAHYYRTKDEDLKNKLINIVSQVKLINAEFLSELANMVKLAQMNGDTQGVQILSKTYASYSYLL